MARIDIILPDEVEKRLRMKAVEKFGGRKGSISEAVTEAIEEWLKKK